METEVIAYQPKPDDEVHLRCNVPMPRDLSHSICGVAWMDEENRGMGLWMVLRKHMSSDTREKGSRGFVRCTYADTNTAHDSDGLELLFVLVRYEIMVDCVYLHRTEMVTPPQREV